MKMNKIIIPAAMLAVGVALIGSVSSTLAWYQYSTKAQAAYIGTSVGETENLEIKVKDGEGWKWVSRADSGDINNLLAENVGSHILPVSPAVAAADGNLDEDDALPSQFYNSVETGVSGIDTYGSRRADVANYVQFTLNVRYNKNGGFPAKKIMLNDLTITDAAGQSNAEGDLYKAVRVHFSTSSNKYLFLRDDANSNEKVATDTFGKLDTDNSGTYDTEWGYEWESPVDAIYGVNNSTQTALNTKFNGAFSNKELGRTISSDGDGLAITVTIWIEGWQKLSGTKATNKDNGNGAIWDPTIYNNKQFKVGMRFQAEDIA